MQTTHRFYHKYQVIDTIWKVYRKIQNKETHIANHVVFFCPVDVLTFSFESFTFQRPMCASVCKDGVAIRLELSFKVSTLERRTYITLSNT